MTAALIVAATTAAMDRKVRMVCHRSQRDWIDRQSAGRVADWFLLLALLSGMIRRQTRPS